MKSYHNTTDSSGQTLIEYNQKAQTQEQKILNYFKRTGEMLTPSEVYNDLFKGSNIPITSIRRAMSNLTRDKELVKTEHQAPGKLGKPEYIWRLA